MIAHLYIPAIDSKANTPTSISYKAVTSLLQKKMGFDGLIVTDALEMESAFQNIIIMGRNHYKACWRATT